VKTFDPPILRRLAGLNVDQFNLPFDAPCQKMPAGEFRPVVHPNRSRYPALGDDRIQHTRHSAAGETGITSKARHSRVKASTTLSTRIARPYSTASCTKSSAHSWFAELRASSGFPSRTQCFRFFRRIISCDHRLQHLLVHLQSF
jgi:hypothetical protein